MFILGDQNAVSFANQSGCFEIRDSCTQLKEFKEVRAGSETGAWCQGVPQHRLGTWKMDDKPMKGKLTPLHPQVLSILLPMHSNLLHA